MQDAGGRVGMGWDMLGRILWDRSEGEAGEDCEGCAGGPRRGMTGGGEAAHNVARPIVSLSQVGWRAETQEWWSW